MSCLLKVPSGVHFTWFPGVKWILLRICSCIMKLQPYTSELRANTKCIPRAFCFSNLRSGFDFTAVFQIIMAKYNQNMVDKIQNFKHAGKDSFNLGVKSLTHYKFINSYSLNWFANISFVWTTDEWFHQTATYFFLSFIKTVLANWKNIFVLL